jgi:hypothetical protein
MPPKEQGRKVSRKPPKFGPNKAVGTLVLPVTTGNTAATVLVPLKILALTELLAWAILDQPENRTRLPDRKKKAPTRPTRTVNARRAGFLALARELDRAVAGRREELPAAKMLMTKIMLSGGFLDVTDGRSGRSIKNAAKKSLRALDCVYEITSFMCRYHKQFGREGPKFSLTHAKHFAVANYRRKAAHRDSEPHDLWQFSKVSQVWERYKDAAPYIFATPRYLRRSLERATSTRQLLDALAKVASSPMAVRTFIGKAAYAADVLAKRAHQVRVSDFDGVSRIEPKSKAFGPEEISIIENIDLNAPILGGPPVRLRKPRAASR